MASSSFTKPLILLSKVTVPPIVEPTIKNPCPTGMYLFGILELVPIPLIVTGATGPVPPVKLSAE